MQFSKITSPTSLDYEKRPLLDIRPTRVFFLVRLVLEAIFQNCYRQQLITQGLEKFSGTRRDEILEEDVFNIRRLTKLMSQQSNWEF